MIILRNARLLPVLTEGFEGNFADIILEDGTVGSYLLKLTKKYGKPNVPKMSKLHHDTKDHDYYDD